MEGQIQSAKVNYIVLTAVVDSPGVVTQIKVEQRDFQYRLVTRHQSSPLTGGGTEMVVTQGTALWLRLLQDQLSADTPPLGSQDHLDR